MTETAEGSTFPPLKRMSKGEEIPYVPPSDPNRCAATKRKKVDGQMTAVRCSLGAGHVLAHKWKSFEWY